MSSVVRGVLLILLVGRAFTALAGVAPPQLRMDLEAGFPRHAALVHAQCIKTEEIDGAFTGTFRIDRVYFSGDQLQDSTFQTITPRKPGLRRIGITPVPAVGEAGVFILVRHKNGEWTTRDDRSFRARFPARNRDPENYQRGLEFAETVEQFSQAAPGERQRLARTVALSAVPELATYAILLLANSGRDRQDVATSLHGLLSEPDLSLGGQVTIDEVLTAIEADWRTSPARLELYQHWARGKWPSSESSHIQGRIRSLARSCEAGIDVASRLALLTSVIENPDIPDEQRPQFIKLAAVTMREPTDENPTFAWLLDVLRTDRQPAARMTAAHSLGRAFGAAAGPRRTAILEAIENNADASLRKELMDVLELGKY